MLIFKNPFFATCVPVAVLRDKINLRKDIQMLLKVPF